jgi:hypothetical protein
LYVISLLALTAVYSSVDDVFLSYCAVVPPKEYTILLLVLVYCAICTGNCADVMKLVDLHT